jgi:hypothetical protein
MTCGSMHEPAAASNMQNISNTASLSNAGIMRCELHTTAAAAGFLPQYKQRLFSCSQQSSHSSSLQQTPATTHNTKHPTTIIDCLSINCCRSLVPACAQVQQRQQCKIHLNSMKTRHADKRRPVGGYCTACSAEAETA